MEVHLQSPLQATTLVSVYKAVVGAVHQGCVFVTVCLNLNVTTGLLLAWDDYDKSTSISTLTDNARKIIQSIRQSCYFSYLEPVRLRLAN
jgi:hypothetical protein